MKLTIPDSPVSGREISALLRGEPVPLRAWSERLVLSRLGLHLGVLILGAGLYGAAMGWWRAPQQAWFSAVKFPLIFLGTALGNTLLNGMLAPLLGLNLPLRQAFLSMVMSIAIAAAILGAFAPLAAFLVWNLPPLASKVHYSAGVYSLILITHVAVIALAGVVANYRLLQLLRQLAGSTPVARRVLFAWLAGNLFVGSQVAWILRPFFGSPDLPVQFLRAHPLAGNFYEALLWAALQLFKTTGRT